jgi:hypothetical protein
MADWNYKDFYKKYDMTGEIKIGTGIIKVHDIFNSLPNFMKQADFIFSDPPCSLGNINTFYTKADIEEKQSDYEKFKNRFFECIDEINPKTIAIEVFASNKKSFLKEIEERFKYVTIYNSTYYHKKDKKCWIIVGSNTKYVDFKIEGIDEEDAIDWICKNADYNCIGDLCMGRGLVGFGANEYGRKFVGTELNKKRLAVLIERINKGSKKV